MKRVLIVDDHETNIYLLRVLMQSHGWEVDEARNGAVALVKARQRPPQLVISDLLMPVIDGYMLLRYWRADPQLRDIPFVVYTATYNEPKDEQLALDLGADAFVLKPTEPNAFLARINAVMSSVLTRPARSPTAEHNDEIGRDYSEILVRKLEEKSLQLSEANIAIGEREQRLQMALSAARMGTWDWDMTTGRIEWSRGHEELWGLPVGSFQGTYAEFNASVHPDDRDDLANAIKVALETRGEYNYEYRVIRPDQNMRWVAGRGQAAYDNDGNPTRMTGIVIDISDRRAAEAARELSQAQLRESEARLRGILDSLVAFVGLFSLDGILLEANRAPLAAAGIEKASVIGKPVIDTFWINHSPHTQAQLSAMIARAAKGENVREDLDIRVAGGSLILLDTTVGPLYDTDGRIVQVVASGVDVTDRKRAEAMRLKLEAELSQAQKMEALGTLAGGVAHDFNNILSIILGNAEIAYQDLGADESTSVSLDEILKAGRRAKNIVQQILAFSRKQPLQRSVVTLRLIVEECASMMSATLPANIELTLQHDDATPKVLADATQLHQVLLNLGTNACHALVNKPGRIVFRSERAFVSAAFAAQHDGLRSGEYAVLSIIDNGAGMDAATQARIFEPFFTTKATGQGTGLGLAVVDGIVRAHDGVVVVESTPGSGTTFKVYLPAALDEDATYSKQPKPAPPSGNGQRILYLDDDAALVEVTIKLLERANYRASGFTDPAKALDALRSNPTSFDLVITDHTMPHTSGLQMARLVHALRPTLPVILVSGYVTAELQHRASDAGIRHVAFKPDKIEDLCELVRHGLAL